MPAKFGTKAGVAELADARDSNSRVLTDLWVRFPPPAPYHCCSLSHVKVQWGIKNTPANPLRQETGKMMALSVVHSTVSEVLISSNLSGRVVGWMCHPATHNIQYTEYLQKSQAHFVGFNASSGSDKTPYNAR